MDIALARGVGTPLAYRASGNVNWHEGCYIARRVLRVVYYIKGYGVSVNTLT